MSGKSSTINGLEVLEFVAPKRDPKNQEVLIFSLNRDMVRMQKDMLRSTGVRKISYAHNLDDFKVLIYTRSFGTILINEDVNLDPEMMIAMIRDYKQSVDPFAQVIFITSTCTEALVKLTIRTGYDSILRLPLSKARLWKTIEQICQTERNFVRIGQYFGPDRRKDKAQRVGAAEERRRTELQNGNRLNRTG